MEPRAYTPKELIQALKITWQVCGTADLTDEAAKAMVMQLRQYGGQKAMDALAKVQREVRGRPSLQDVLARLESMDNRPAPEEAWSIGLSTYRDKISSFVVSDEIQEAMGVAWELLNAGDRVAARMAFIEKYQAVVRTKRDNGIAPKWRLSIGEMRTDAPEVLARALTARRIEPEAALAYLHDHEDKAQMLRMAGMHQHPLLAAPVKPDAEGLARVREITAGIFKNLESKP